MSESVPIITHDTYTIIEANDAACELFGYERIDLIDQQLIAGIYGSDMQWLAELRLRTIRIQGELPEQDLPFFRASGSVFWARVKTTKLSSGLFNTTLTYLYEY